MKLRVLSLCDDGILALVDPWPGPMVAQAIATKFASNACLYSWCMVKTAPCGACKFKSLKKSYRRLPAGLSRDLFESWCEDSRNTVIIADFAVQGTLAREILQHPPTVMSKAGIKLQLR